MNLVELTEQINAIVPIHGVNPHNGRIDYVGTPTAQQITDAQALVATFNAQTEQEKRTTVRTALITAARAVNGVDVNALTAGQVRILVVLLLYKTGWISRDLKVDIPNISE
jgi:hypothetical protein